MFGDIFTGRFWHFDSLNYDRAMCLLFVMGLKRGVWSLCEMVICSVISLPEHVLYELKHQRAVKCSLDLGAV